MGTGAGSTSGTQGTASHFVALPLLKAKLAPLKFRGGYRNWIRFLEHYEHTCAQCNVTDDKQKCLGMIQYCSNQIANLVENIPTFIQGDYTQLVKDLNWLFDGDRKKAEHHIGDIANFAQMWRNEKINSLETFKEYHREYIKVAGPLKNEGYIDEKEYNRGFWGGLHRETRDRIERRMTDNEPGLDLAIPFPTEKVIKATEHIYNRTRFDKDLRDERNPTNWPSHRTRRQRHRQRDDSNSKDESGSDEDSEEDAYVPRYQRHKAEEQSNEIFATESRR